MDLVTDRVNKIFGQDRVLDDISFVLKGGQILAIVGPNGSGKSTLIKMIARIQDPTSGTILLNGNEIRKIDPASLATKIGYVPQQFTYTRYSTVFETVLLGRRQYIQWSVSDEELSRVQEALEAMGTEALADRFMDELSGGERQKVFIARALAQNPTIFIFDEPTSALDIRYQIEVMEKMRRITREQGSSMVIALHDLNLAYRYADTILLLSHGRMAGYGSPDAVLTPDRIREVFGIESFRVDNEAGKFILMGTFQDVTERRRIEDALKKSEHRFRQLITLAPIPLCYVNIDGTIEYFNNRFGEVFGYSRDEIPTLSKWRQQAYPDEEYRQLVTAAWEGAVKKASVSGCDIEPAEHSITCKNGTVLHVIVGGITIDTMILATFIDITDRRKAEDALRAGKEMYRSILRASPDSIIITNLDGTVMMVSPATLTIFGFSVNEEAIGHLITDFLVPDDRGRARENILLMLRGAAIGMVDYRACRPDGSTFDIETNADLIRDNTGRPDRIIFMVRDITDRKQAEKAFFEVNKKLKLLSKITRHDINNQIVALDGYLELLHQNVMDPALEPYFLRLTTASGHIADMIRFTREYDTIGVTAPVWQDLHQVVDAAADDLASRILPVVNDIPPGIEVYADPLIVKVFFNLTDNAIRHGGNVTGIRFRLHEPGGIIICEDDGNGVAAGEKEMIFRQGFGKNTGLGLFLSREILSITGIAIRETGVPGAGARFEITVPATAIRRRQ